MGEAHRAARLLTTVVLAVGLLVGCTSAPEQPEVATRAPSAASSATPTAAPTPEPSPTTAPTPTASPTPATVAGYGVSAGDSAAVEAGMSVLARGGNAVDAAVATAFALGVVEPFASGIGGGGAAVVADVGDEAQAYNYREVVPQSETIPAGGVGVPGFVAGMVQLHDERGELPFAELLAPAIRLARDGTPTSATVAAQLRGAAGRLQVDSLPHLFPDGAALDAGDPLVQTALADTMEQVADGGADAFYRGDLATSLSDAVDGIDAASLSAYEVQRSRPATGDFAGLEVVAAAPPLSGTALVQMLQLAEAQGIAAHPPGTADHIHVLSNAWRVAQSTVDAEVGDPAFVDRPPPARTDAAANRRLAEAIPTDRLVDPGELPDVTESSGNTTHLSVVDSAGTMVSMTNSLSNFWGSGRYQQGYFLNSHLSRLLDGGNGLDQVEAGRRSASWSLPTVVRDGEGRPVLAIGSPGGSRIPNVLSQVLVAWALHDVPLQDAVDMPRFHLVGDDLRVEAPLADDVAADLRGRGIASISTTESAFYFGSVQVLEVDPENGEVRGGRDDRREGDWDAAAPGQR